MRNAVLAGFVLASACAGTALAEKSCEDHGSIGSASIDARGVVTLDLVTLPPGPIGHGRLVYGPDHPKYREIRAHLGPIAPGRRVNVRPWC